MIIAIDGPAAVGKTTIGRMVAAELHFALVDTGLLYRAVTVESRRRGIGPRQETALASLLNTVRIELNTDPQPEAGAALVCIDGRDITREALDPAIARDLAQVAQIRAVRNRLVERQRAYATGDVVMLGRDIGTVIFPEADCKFFFTASAAERVARRRGDFERNAAAASDTMLEDEVAERDRADSEREVSPLRAAPDAIIVVTEGKSVHQVFQEVMGRLRAGR